jgi:hypothetical protein
LNYQSRPATGTSLRERRHSTYLIGGEVYLHQIQEGKKCKKKETRKNIINAAF